MTPAATSSTDLCTVSIERFPRTRYQGSKRKLARIIVQHLSTLEFDTSLDAFGGTGAVAYALKCAGKSVTYNDLLTFNHQIGLALIENDAVHLPEKQCKALETKQSGVTYGNFIEQTFEGIYFTREENRWLDVTVENLHRLSCPYQRALGWFALFQAALAKRPYNLFHRKNLYMRQANVDRGFGNKVSWDRSFSDHFSAFVAEANEAVFDSGGRCKALGKDTLMVEPHYDLVYIDTPYINRSGVGVDYRDFYHFLEGMVGYDHWWTRIDRHSKHRRLLREKNPWCDPAQCHVQFRRLFEHFQNSILVVSYRSDGIPSVEELTAMLRYVKKRVRVIDGPTYQYALSTNRRNREVLLIAAG